MRPRYPRSEGEQRRRDRRKAIRVAMMQAGPLTDSRFDDEKRRARLERWPPKWLLQPVKEKQT